MRYAISADSIVANCFHCLDCQAKSNSAFGISVWFSTSQFKIMQGHLAQYTFTLDSGEEKLCAFCPDCGSRIYNTVTD
ncbi:MAG: hypothetical protein EBY77_03805 [Rhodobacteraceae bacterium]|nr:hypothetical protein [Paracoccaceae bacterium]